MKLTSKPKFIIGIFALILIILSYFIKINSESGSNYQTQDTLLGILIFHNPLVLFAYIIISFFLIISGIKKIELI